MRDLLRGEIAAAIYGHIIQADLSVEGGCMPPLCDEDFAPNENGSWAKRKDVAHWSIANAHESPVFYLPGQYMLISTPEQRRARFAVRHADALIEELIKQRISNGTT